MIKVQESYQERMSHFWYLHKRMEDLVKDIFPKSEEATIEDAVELRKLVDRMEYALSIAEGVYVMKRLMPLRPPMIG
jgi:hypothetical protein